MHECISGDVTDVAGEHTTPSTGHDLHAGAGGARPGCGSHLDTGRLLVVIPLGLILQPDRALAPPGCVKLLKLLELHLYLLFETNWG